MIADKKHMTVSAVARYLDVNRRTIDRYIEIDPSFPSPRVTPKGRRQFLTEEVKAYERSLREAGANRPIMIDGVEHVDAAASKALFDLPERTLRILQNNGLIGQPVEIQARKFYRVEDLKKVIEKEVTHAAA